MTQFRFHRLISFLLFFGVKSNTKNTNAHLNCSFSSDVVFSSTGSKRASTSSTLLPFVSSWPLSFVDWPTEIIVPEISISKTLVEIDIVFHNGRFCHKPLNDNYLTSIRFSIPTNNFKQSKYTTQQ